jgi:5-methylcytosine-specific restriction endonuclease McrA
MWRWLIWHLKGWLWQRWYKIYLKSDKWAEKRKVILKRDGYRCTKCGSDGKETDWRGRRINPLQIDHTSYKHAGHELNEELRVLCRSCHAKRHGKAVTDVRSGQVAAVFLFFLLFLFILSLR